MDASFWINIEDFSPHVRDKRFERFRYENSRGESALVKLSPRSIGIGYVSNGRKRQLRAALVRGAGNRLYIRCPKCGRSVRRLFLPPGETAFACRLCHQLTHSSTQQYDNRLKEYRLFFRSWRESNKPRITIEAIREAALQSISRGDLG